MEQILKKHFGSDVRRTYQEVRFAVPEGMRAMTVRYDYDKTKKKLPGTKTEECNAVDIALNAADGCYVGSSGSSKKEIYLSEIYSTPGYKKTPITAGEWTLTFGFEKVKSSGCDITITITFEEKKARFYKGDCHTHTVHSDGHTSMKNIIKKAKRNGLDFFICTDHNTDTACAVYPSVKDLNIMPGLELTCYKGHFNLLCVEKPLTDGFKFESVEELNKRLLYAKEKGALLSMNHPHCKNCGWRLPFEGFEYDLVEVWNAVMRIDNESTISWWHQELLKGERKVAVGGSDFHADYVVTDLFAMPCTVVYAENNAPAEIKEGLSKGHCYITHKPDTSEMILTCRDKMMGDVVAWEEGMQAHLHVTKLKRGHTLRIYNNDTVVYERIGKGEKVLELDFAVPEKGFVRAEIVHTLNPIMKLGFRFGMALMMPQDAKLPVPPFHWALTNPLYFE